MRKTKIICTIGPASESEDMLRGLMCAGMDVARLNFSHGSRAEQLAKIEAIKRVRGELGLFTAILLDTKGPEIRTGKFENGETIIKEGQKFTLSTESRLGDNTGCTVTYEGLSGDVKAGDRILIDDGLISLIVDEINGNDIICTAENGGKIKNSKGINVPSVNIKLPSLTEKDKQDLLFGIENGVDYIAASFIRNAEDVRGIRYFLDYNGGEEIRIISKIENKEGLTNIDEIIEVSDGIMVARGDLGVEIPEEDVPIAQKEIIRKCNEAGKIVVTATQMLDSMMRNPRPTRAEITDVANAILDGTDAIMLSGETASGKYPLDSVKMMEKIACKTEAAIVYDDIHYSRAETKKKGTITDTIGHCTCMAAKELSAKAILTPTSSGNTAFAVAKFRPETQIIAPTYSEHVARRLALCWGTSAIVIEKAEHQRDVYANSVNIPKERGMLKDGDCVIITAGVPLLVQGNTNLMRIHIVGNKLG
ncbi:MAG: pyruvate kinase [Firmicutes bacterium]|nr:pyruvate kinase [Bacillota bacterium]